MMDDKTALIIEKLADKFGVTAEHLWGVLLRQAPIDAVITTIVLVALWGAFVFAYRRVKLIEFDREPLVILLAILGIGLLITSGLGFSVVAAAIFNPEYWALKQIIK